MRLWSAWLARCRAWPMWSSAAFFGGYGEEDTARALGVSLRTVQRDWLKARAWLLRELGGAVS
jgi:ECF sigma factor